MLKIKNESTKKLIKGIAIFAVVAIALQLFAIVLATPGGLGSLYPYVLYFNSENITIGDSGVGEYFPIHNEVEDAGLVVLSVDMDVADSYKLAADFLNFLGKFTNVSAVALYTQNTRVSGMSDGIISGEYEKYEKAAEIQKESGILCDQMFTFADSVYNTNSRLSPDNKIPIKGIKSHDSYSDIYTELMTELYITPGGTNGEHVEILDAKSAEEYVRLFKKHEEKLKDILGKKFDGFKEKCGYVEENAVEENYAFNNLKRLVAAEEGKTAYAILPERLCKDGSVFIKRAEEYYGRVTVINTVYYDCERADGDEVTVRNDGSFPVFADGIMIAPAGELKGFRDYYSKVVNSFSSDSLKGRMDVIGDAGDKTFFIIVGSEAVSYDGDEEETKTVGTVNEAPG